MAGTEAQASAQDTGNPPEDPAQQGSDSWGWGWWGTNTWQGSSSDGGWWGRHGRDDGDGDAWSRWNRGRHGSRAGGYGGYGGADRLRPKPAQTAAALGRHLTREEWIQELIADPPNPAHPEFRAPGAWERWVRGAFITYGETGKAKYRVKMKRASQR